MSAFPGTSGCRPAARRPRAGHAVLGLALLLGGCAPAREAGAPPATRPTADGNEAVARAAPEAQATPGLHDGAAPADTSSSVASDTARAGPADTVAQTPADTTRAALAPADTAGVGEMPPAFPPDGADSPPRFGEGDEFFGRTTARGVYEIRSLATGATLGREDWELLEDAAGFRTLRATSELAADGARSSRSAAVTVTPELDFVAAELGSNVEGVASYASYRRAGDLLTVEAHGDGNGEVRQQVRLPEDGVFVSQVFATRGWELAAFDRPEESTRPAYLSGSAPGVLIGEVKTLSARRAAQEDLRLPAGVFRTLRFEIPPAEAASDTDVPNEGGGAEVRDRWWILMGSRIPAAAELPSLGVRVELSELIQDPEPVAHAAGGAVLARGIYHHRLLRRTETAAVESWTLSAEPGGGYLLESDLAYAEGPRTSVRALADSAFRVHQLQVRRIGGRGSESTSITLSNGELRGEARGGAVGVAEQRLTLGNPAVFRIGSAALEGWAIVAGGGRGAAGGVGGSGADGGPGTAAAGGETAPASSDTLPSDSLRGAAPSARSDTYWLPAGPHPLGVLISLPADVDLGAERVPTPARTFSTRRYASPAETPSLFRAVRWVFEPYRLPARVLFPGLGRDAILVRYETPE